MTEEQEQVPKEYTIEEVSEHKSKEDIYIVIKSKVYNVTEFLEEHPGGADILIEHAGKDATKDFEDVGHSSTADELMKKYLIGDLKRDENAQQPADNENNVPVAFTSCFKSFKSIKERFGFK